MCVFVNVERKKQNATSLPRGAVGTGAFAESPMQLRSATLGKIFPGRVFPGLPSVVAQGARQRNFFAESPMQYARQLWEKIFLGRVFLDLPSVVAQGARQRIFFKKIKNRLCRRPCQVRSAHDFLKKIGKQTQLNPDRCGSRTQGLSSFRRRP
jgi:hypothetical protein